MSKTDEALLSLHATIALSKAEESFKRCSEDEKRTGMTIRAYYLGRHYPNSDFNPFVAWEHRFKQDLIDGFALGAANGALLAESDNTQDLIRDAGVA